MTDYDDLVRRANEYVNEWPGIPEAGPLVKALVEQLKLESTVRLQCATDSQNHLDRALAAEAENAALREALIDVLASLVAAHSLLEGGGKKAAASDKMFYQMLKDYAASIARGRAALLAGKRDAAMREGKVE